MKVRGLFEGRQWIASIKQGRKLLRACARNRARDWLKSLRMYRAARQKDTSQEGQG